MAENENNDIALGSCMKPSNCCVARRTPWKLEEKNCVKSKNAANEEKLFTHFHAN